MESRIEELLTKYWDGETTLREEEELKAYFKDNPSLTPTGLYFRGIKKSAEIESDRKFRKPGSWFSQSRYAVAATVAIGILVGALILRDTAKNDFEVEDPEEAYAIAQLVLQKMSASLNEAQTHSLQLKKINKAEEIIKEEQL